MKVSAILPYATFFLVFMYSQTLFAANAPAGTQDLRKAPATATPQITQKKNGILPPMIKINASDIKVPALVDSNMQSAKATGQSMSVQSELVSGQLTQLERSISIWRNKVNECTNKTYTTEDMKKAGCKDDMTVAQCSRSVVSQRLTE